MDNSKHIKEFTIGNYRRFVDFEVDNVGQFNLIVGDNNTGKTSLLESLIFASYQDVNEILTFFDSTLYFRNKDIGKGYNSDNDLVYENFDQFTANENEVSFSFNYVSQTDLVVGVRKYLEEDFDKLNAESKNLIKFDSTILESSFLISINKEGHLKKLKLKDFKINNYFVPFIPYGLGYGYEIPEFYSEIQKEKSKKHTFIENVRSFIPNIEDINIDVRNGINIVEKGLAISKPLYSFGEGANKIFRILLELAKSTNKQLMIDEIDTGIHHSRFLSFWKTVLKVAKNYNVQLFATTHNEECIKFYRQALEELELENPENKALFSDEARLISLREIDEEVQAFVYGLEDMQYADEVGRELRGGA